MKKKNLVAKHAKSTTSGAGPHKDKKKAVKRGEIKHKKKYVESFDNGGEEYNDEAGMLKTNLHTMMRACKGLHKLVGPEENLPEWAQEKIAQAKGMIVAVWDYMESQHEEGNIYTNKIDLINKSNEQGVAEGSSMFAWNAGTSEEDFIRQFGKPEFDRLTKKYGISSIPVPDLHGYRPTKPTDPLVRRHRGLDGMGAKLKSIIVNYNGVNILFQKDDDEIFVKASSGGRELGHVLFVIDGDYLMPQDLEVEERFRGQGIAQTMYDYVKSKGYKIRRSGQQTDAGAGFWDKHKGQGQNVWEQGVAEGAPELLKKEMPLHRHAEKLLAQNGVSKKDPDYHHHLNNTIKHLRQFGNIDLINKIGEQGVAEGAMSDLDADRKAKQYKGTQDYHARKKLEDYIRTKERVIAGGNALSPGERRSLAQARKELKALLAQARKELKALTSKNQGVAEGQGEQLSKTKALNILRKELMNSYEYMKCENLEEFKQRLQWLSEGMLKNHMTNGKSTVINSEEIKLYQEYRKKREQIQRGLTQGVAEGNAYEDKLSESLNRALRRLK